MTSYPAPTPIRILLIAAANSTTGGGERHVVDLVQGLVARGFTVAVAAPAGGDLQHLATQLDVPYYPTPIASGFKLKTIRQLRVDIASFDPDIVHAHGTRAALFARLSDTKASQRVIYTVHGIHANRGTGKLIKLPLERWLLPRTAHFITVCESDKRRGIHLRILDPEHTTTIYNGVAPYPAGQISALRTAAALTLRAELKLDAHTPLILHIGRASGQKDQLSLLKAFKLLREKTTAVHLALVVSGDPSEVWLLEEAIRRYKLGEYVHWLTPRPDLETLYAGCDVFALSSLWEGFPYVIIEAANYATPIVSTAVDGIPEAITSPNEGLLVPPGNPQAFADALDTLLQQGAQEHKARLNKGLCAKRHVNTDFTLQKMLDRTIAVYKSLL